MVTWQPVLSERRPGMGSNQQARWLDLRVLLHHGSMRFGVARPDPSISEETQEC